MNEEELMRERDKHMIDIRDGEYFDEFLEELPHYADGAGKVLLMCLLEGGTHSDAALSQLRRFYDLWCDNKAGDLAREGL